MTKNKTQRRTDMAPARLFLDTCVWLDLAGNEANDPLLAALETLCEQRDIELAVDAPERDPHRRGRQEGGGVMSLVQPEAEGMVLPSALPSNHSNDATMDAADQLSACCPNCESTRVRNARVRSAFWHNDRLVVIEDVPALVCSTCGEQFYDDAAVLMMDRMRAGGFPPENAVRELRVPVFAFVNVASPEINIASTETSSFDGKARGDCCARE